MDKFIALARETGITAGDLIAAWNETPECRAVAVATTGPTNTRTFDPFGETLMMVLTSVAGGVTGNLLTDLIKMTVLKAREKKALAAAPSKRVTHRKEAIIVQMVDNHFIAVGMAEEETHET